MTLLEQQRDALQYLHALLVKNARTYTLVLSIIFVVSYVGVLRPPHPTGAALANAVNGMPPPLSWPQALFLCFNSFTFLSALSGLLLTATIALSAGALSFSSASSCREEDAATWRKHLAAMTPKAVLAGMFLVVSTTSCAVAFLLAGLSSVREGAALSERLSVIVPCAMGTFVFLQALLIFGRDEARFFMQVRAFDGQLWIAIKEETLAGRLLTMWVELVQARNTTTTILYPVV